MEQMSTKISCCPILVFHPEPSRLTQNLRIRILLFLQRLSDYLGNDTNSEHIPYPARVQAIEAEALAAGWEVRWSVDQAEVSLHDT